MSNDKQLARLWKLQTQINRLVLEGKRDPESLLETYQSILEEGSWELRDGLIYFSVTSDGTTGEEWVAEFGSDVSKYAKSVLLSPDFHPTKNITYQITVVPGKLFTSDPTTKEIREDLDVRGIRQGKVINAEIACLIRRKFTNEQLEAMGVWYIVVMHEPIKDSDGGPSLLGARRHDGVRRLDAYYDFPSNRWNRYGGFAGVLSQVSTQC